MKRAKLAFGRIAAPHSIEIPPGNWSAFARPPTHSQLKNHIFLYMKTLLLSTALLGSVSLHAELSMLPSPIDQGGMIHADVTFKDQANDTFQIMLHHGMVELQPLGMWAPGETFNPSDPWFPELDPTMGNKAFGSRYGILINGAESDFLPAGKSFGIRVSAIDDGLTGYNYSHSEGSEQFVAVLDEVGDAVQWSGNMWHPVFVADEPGIYMATLEFFIVDDSFSGFVSPTSSAMDGAYSTGTVNLMMTAVPEPTAYALAAGALCLGIVLIRRRLRK